MKALSDRQIQILSGEAGLPRDKVQQYSQLWTSLGYVIPVPLRELAAKAISLGEAVVEHAAGGFRICSAEESARRLTWCRNCPSGKFQEPVCQACGCNMRVKATWEEQDCPKGHWNRGVAESTFRWCVGVTAAPRRDSQLEACLQSLVANGWSPIVFAEPRTDVSSAVALGLRIVMRDQQLGCWRNWLEMSRQLVAEFPDVDAIMTVQDDTVFHPEAKRFVEAHGLWPADPERVGFFSFYTAKHYQYRYNVVREDGTLVGNYPFVKAHDIVERAKKAGWRKRRAIPVPVPAGPTRIHTGGFWGACALAFPPKSLDAITKSRIAREWKGANGNQVGVKIKNSDTAIGKVCRTLELSMWAWNPSLAQHVALHSTLGHGGNSGRRAAHRMTRDPWKDAEPRQLLDWVSMNELDRVCAGFAGKLPKDIRAVAGVPRSGVLAAAMMANHLHLPLIPIEACLGDDVQPYRPVKSRPLRAIEGKVLIVDDAVSSGKTLKELRGRIKVPHYLASPLSTIRGREHVAEFGKLVGTPQVFQWNWLAVNYTEQFLFDMDGVIVEDWQGGAWKKNRRAYDYHLTNGKPLYLPRRKILAVVTGRSELVRKETEAWLARHGVEYGELVMRADDDRRDHSVFKAEVYQRFSAALCFVESSEVQAAAIAQATGRSVLSVETWKMHNQGSPAWD